MAVSTISFPTSPSGTHLLFSHQTKLSPHRADPQQTSPLAAHLPLREMDSGPNKAPKQKLSAQNARPKQQAGDDRLCHQCHRPRQVYLRCTSMRTRGKKTGQCGLSFCDNCLKRRYDVSASAISSTARPEGVEGHAATESYIWRCPVCDQSCNCSKHRRASGLSPAGRLLPLAKVSGHSLAELLRDPQVEKEAKEAKEANELDERKEMKEKKKAKRGGQAKEGNAKSTLVPIDAPGGTTESDPIITNNPLGKDVLKVLKAPKVVSKKRSAPDGENKPVTKREKKSKQEKPGKQEKPSKQEKPGNKEKPGKQRPKATVVVHGPRKTLPVAPLSVLEKPKHVEAPVFQHIEISHPLPVIHNRLQIREFALRFERRLKLTNRYMRALNDPNEIWTDLTYKNLILSLLAVAQDGELDPGAVWEAHESIKKTSSDSPEIWATLKMLLGEYTNQGKEMNLEGETDRSYLVVRLMHCALMSTQFRLHIEQDMAAEKKVHQATTTNIRNIRSKHAEERATYSHARQLLAEKPEELAIFDERRAKAVDTTKRLIKVEQEREWWECRKLTNHTMPLGVDVFGNTYWMFQQRTRQEEDWGQWVVMERPDKDLLTILPDPIDDNEETKEEVAKRSKWFAFSGSEEIRHLADWIKYEAELLFYKKALAARNHQTSTPTTNAATPATPITLSKQILKEVRVTIRHIAASVPPSELVTEESIDGLTSQLYKVATFMGLWEDGSVGSM